MPFCRCGVKDRLTIAGALALFALAAQLQGQSQRQLSGKVVMEDGSTPPKPALIERSCGGRNQVVVTSTNKQGEFRWEETTMLETAEGNCIWRAVLPGYASDELDMGDIQESNHLRDIVLHSESSVVPPGATERHIRALKAIEAHKWTEAEGQLRAILAQYPKSGPIYEELGYVLVKEERPAEARPMLERAIELAPGELQSYGQLIQLQFDAGDYAAAEKTAVAGTEADIHGTLPELYYDLAEVRFHLKEEGAEAAARKAVALDKQHKTPRAEYVLGLILADGEDYASAIEHLRRYLAATPNAPEAAAVKARIKALQASAAAEAAEAAATLPNGAPIDKSPEGATEVAVPGGLQALAVMARLKRVPAAADFFREYCGAIADDADLGGRSSDPGLTDAIETFLAAAVELSHLAENRAGRITLSPDALPTSKTATVLKLFGWKYSPKGLGGSMEIGETPADSPRQQIPGALGVDEIEAAKTLASGASFHFEVHSAEAPLLEARAWRTLAGGLPPGGFAEVFARNPRYAVAYAGLAAMGPGAASALISGVGLRVLVNKYADAMRLYGESFAVSGDRAVVPGGPEADAGWERLAGASPRDPKAFFGALLAKDQGKLAAFYFALARGDAARQRFFTGNAGAAEQFYKWYRDSDDFRSRASPLYEAWRQRLFRELPLDSDGGVRFPGGRAAWTSASGADADILTGVTALQALVPIANLEQTRKAPLDEASARLLAEHYAAWRPLFPYFEKLPGLGRAEFEALATFDKSVSGRPPDVRNAMLGEWHSLVKLIELGTAAGSLDAAGGARGFRRVCEALTAPDHSAQSLAALREIAGGADDLDEAVPAALLRLRGQRRASFDRLREMLQTPPLKAVSGGALDRTRVALTGQVYAALLDPDVLLVSEDPQIASRHAFLGDARGASVFGESGFETFHHAASSHFSGGFTTFEEVAAKLARTKPSEAAPAPPAAAAVPTVAVPEAAAGPAEPSDAVFRTNARLVEVYATATEEGRYLDDLDRRDFTVLDNGQPVQFGTFENLTAGFTVALVLDTTGSMLAALPALKSSALKLIDDLRPVDTVAVYSFNESVYELQAFTKNKDLAKRAVLRTRASGNTGLHDALVRVTRDLSSRPGKKAIVVFTDGADNSSALTADAVIRRANTDNVRVYTITHGDALASHELTDQLANLAKSTGGLSFGIANPTQISAVFEHIAQDLLHGYLLAFQPPVADGKQEWRTIQIVLRDENAVNPPKVRTRSGYFSEN
jgi:Ca-activated chloride channel family protein